MARWTYFHTLDPFIIQLTENIGLRWYSLSYILGFLCAYYLIDRYLIKKKVSELSQSDWADQVVWSIVGIIIGGRLAYAIFYSPHLFMDWDSSFPFWGVLKIHQGGMASHGGILGAIVANLLFARKRNFSILHCLDLVSATAGLGIFFGRLANFINGELYGRVIQGTATLAVQFPQEMFNWVYANKTEHLKSLAKAVSALNPQLNTNLWYEWIYQASNGSSSDRIYSVIYSLITACQQGNQKVILALKEVLSYRHPSQLYQAVLEGLLPFIITWFFWRKARQPGMVCILFGICYALMRTVGEIFRMPDIQLGFRALGLTRGQWLSLIMLMSLFIFWMLIAKQKKTQTKLGGWKQ